MKTIWSFLGLVFLSASTLAVEVIDDISTYKPCFAGGCDGEEVCFQYFCYPKSGMETPLRSCKKNKNCKGLGDYECHKPSPLFGVCVPSADNELCEGHKDCKDRGGKCCGDYCCNEEYFKELQKKECSDDNEVCSTVQAAMLSYDKESLACESNEECERDHVGHKCCSDNSLLTNISLSKEIENWGGSKRCCMSATETRELSKLIPKLEEADVKKIDDALSNQTNKMELCNDFKTEPLLNSKFKTCKLILEQAEQEKQEKQAIQAKKDALNDIQEKANKAVSAAEKAKNHMIEAEQFKNDTLDAIKEANMINGTGGLTNPGIKAAIEKAEGFSTKASEAATNSRKEAKNAENAKKAAIEASTGYTSDASSFIDNAEESAKNANKYAKEAEDFSKEAKNALKEAKEAYQTEARNQGIEVENKENKEKDKENKEKDKENAVVAPVVAGNGNAIRLSIFGLISTMTIYFF